MSPLCARLQAFASRLAQHMVVTATVLGLCFSILASTTSRAHGQQSVSDVAAQPAPRTLPRPTLPTPSYRLPDLARSPQLARGELGVEILGGLGASALSIGLGLASAYLVNARCETAQDLGPDEEIDYPGCSVVSVALGVTVAHMGLLFLVPGAVVAHGRDSGGTGSYGWALLGSSLGMVTAGLLAPMLLDTIVGSGEFRAEHAVLVLSLAAAASTAGAVIGYRLSADIPVQASVAPTLDGRGAVLSIQGAF